MKSLRSRPALSSCSLRAPRSAPAGELAARDVSAGVTRAPHRFDLVGLHWRGTRLGLLPHALAVRALELAGDDAAPEDDRPDARTHEPRGRGWKLGSPYWTGPSDRIQVRTSGRVGRVRAYYVWSPVGGEPARARHGRRARR